MRSITEILVCACLLISTAYGARESELRKDIFEDYDKLVRPVKNALDAVQAEIHLGLLVIKEVDIEGQTASFDTWLFLTWQDEFLKWDPRNYGGLAKLIIPPSEVWKPDIGLYSGTPNTNIFPSILTNVIIYSNGTCIWELPFTVNTLCYEPQPKSNTYECSPTFRPWTYDVRQVNLRKYVTDVLEDSRDIFRDINGEWTFESVRATRNVLFYKFIRERFSTVSFDIVFKRKEGNKENKISKEDDYEYDDSEYDDDDYLWSLLLPWF